MKSTVKRVDLGRASCVVATKTVSLFWRALDRISVRQAI